MHLEVLVEEPSAKIALERLLAKLVPDETTFRIHAHQGKPALLRKLPDRLAAYAKMNWPELRLLVLVDRDNDDCHELKERLEKIAVGAGFTTKTRAGGSVFRVVNRLAIEELEAWFLGDVDALRIAYPEIPKGLANRARYRNPDAIRGGTAEALARVLRTAGYHREGLPKTYVADAVARHMDPSRNRSRSFQCFCEGVEALSRGGS
jgi:hypothetical protein